MGTQMLHIQYASRWPVCHAQDAKWAFGPQLVVLQWMCQAIMQTFMQQEQSYQASKQQFSSKLGQAAAGQARWQKPLDLKLMLHST